MIIAKAPNDTLTCTLVEKAYVAVSDIIQQEIILSGQKIFELRLAKELGIYRTPSRQALQLLEGKGFLTRVLADHISYGKSIYLNICKA